MRMTHEEYKNHLERREQGLAKLPKKHKEDPEHQEQKALIEWADRLGYPYNLLFAIPNGGGRSKMEAGKLKAEGVRKGVPDLFLPVSCGGFHGLFVEMKAHGSGRESVEQKSWHQLLDYQGYKVVTCWGWDQARQAINDYTGGIPC